MNNVSGEKKDNKLIIALSGHIDSANADAVEQDIAVLREGCAADEVTVDAEKLEYISSAGLRILLRLRKAYPGLRIVSVSPAVYEVLEMTGFTEMITVEKAYRRISVDGCEAIGQGANGKVYRIDKDTIVKVYRNPDSLPDIKRETALARTAFVLGIPTAIPFDVVRVGDGYGSVFEMLNAKSFAKLLAAHPENVDTYVRQYVDLLKTIHTTTVKPGDMPDMKKVAVGWAEFDGKYLPDGKGERLVKLVSGIPERQTMLHGDYHVKNIMLQDDEVLLIDMDTLCYGHPIFELGTMFLAYEGFGICDHKVIENFLGISYDAAQEFYYKSLRLYLDADDETVETVKKKSMLAGYTRLFRRAIRRDSGAEEDKALIAACKAQLLELIDSVDSLDF